MSMNADLTYGTQRHQQVLDALIARIDLSEEAMENKRDEWETAEKQFVFHLPEKESDALRRTAREAGKPQYTTLEVPYTYAQMMTAHTYLSSVFLSRNPVLGFQGRHGEPEMNVQAVESIMDYQTQVGGHLAPYYVWLHDGAKYGVGVIWRYWDREVTTYSEVQEEPVMLLGVPIEGKTKKTKTTKQVVGYEGNRLFNVRPHDYLPDPRVPMGQPQKGEYVGRKVDIAWNTIIKRKLSGQYINVDEVKKRLKTSGTGQNRRAAIVQELELPQQSAGIHGTIHTQSSLVSTLDGIELVVELIPNEWGLGSTEHPENWCFTVLDKKIIVEARPFNEMSGKFPVEVIETEIEGYGLSKRGMLEIGKPLNDVMTWLINSHFFAVRKSLNGDVIYDPSRIVSSDLLNSDGTGSRIRLRPSAYGQDVRTMVHHLQGGADVTGTHLRDSEIVGQLLQRVLGVTDNLLGSVNPGGRKTATEVRTASSSSVNRLRTISEYISASGFTPLAQQLLQSTQQHYTADKKFKIVGDQVNRAEQFVEVNAESIAGFYDYIPADGTLPLDRFAMVNMWAQLLGQLRNFPQVAQEYNMSEVFAWVAQLAGLKNIKQMRVNVIPDEQFMGAQGVRQPGAADPRRPATGGTAGNDGEGGPVVPLAPQVPGVGRAG